MLRAGVRRAYVQEPVAAAAAAIEDDVEREMAAEDSDIVDSDSDVDSVALSVCSALWCCCEQTPVAKSEASRGQNAYPERQTLLSRINKRNT